MNGPQNDGKNLDVAYSSSTTTKVETKTSKEGATFGEYPATQSVGLKSTVNQPTKVNESTGYNSIEGEYTSSTSGKIENKDSKEGATFGEYPTTQSVGLKSTVNNENNPKINESTGYNSVEGEYKSTTSAGLKSTMNKPEENKDMKSSVGYNSMEGEYASTSENKPKVNESCGYNSIEGEYSSSTSGKIENKELKSTVNQPNLTTSTGYNSAEGEYPVSQSLGIKSTLNQTVKLTTSTGYNANEGEYTSTSMKIENKDSKEAATLKNYPLSQSIEIKPSISQPIGVQQNLTASTGYNSMEGEYAATQSVGIKSSISQPIGVQPNLTASLGYSQAGPYLSPNPIPVGGSINQAQPPLIIKVPANAPIINTTNIPLGNVKTTVTKITETTTS